jgi:hypothetical protein
VNTLRSTSVTRYKFDLVTLTIDLWPWKSIGFETLLRTKYVPNLVKIHWRMLILECSQGCYRVKNGFHFTLYSAAGYFLCIKDEKCVIP